MIKEIQLLIELSLVDILWNNFRGNKKSATLIWKIGLQLEATIDSFSECDNGKELDDPDYNEYEGIFVSVIKIVSCTASKDEINNLLGPIPYEGIGYVIHFNNAPDLILDGDTVIWKKPEIPNHTQSDMCSS